MHSGSVLDWIHRVLSSILSDMDERRKESMKPIEKEGSTEREGEKERREETAKKEKGKRNKEKRERRRKQHGFCTFVVTTRNSSQSFQS